MGVAGNRCALHASAANAADRLPRANGAERKGVRSHVARPEMWQYIRRSHRRLSKIFRLPNYVEPVPTSVRPSATHNAKTSRHATFEINFVGQ